MFTMMNTKC